MHDLLRWFVLPAYRPVGGIRGLLQSKQRMGYAALLFLALGVAYTITVQVAHARGLGAAVEPFLKIPADEYYRWQRFFQIPFFFLTSIVFAGVVRLLGEAVGGSGQFVDIFAVFAVAQTLPMLLTMWVPESLIFFFFPGNDFFPMWFHMTRQIAGIAWPVAIAGIGVTLAERIRWYHTVWIILVASVPTAGLMFVFIR